MQAKSTREPMNLEAMFEKKLAELQRGNASDSLKQHGKYVELEEHIQSAIQSASGKYITIVHPFGRRGHWRLCSHIATYFILHRACH